MKKNKGITIRSILLGLALLPFNAYFITQVEMVRYQSWPSILSLTMNSLFLLLVLVLINYPLRRFLPRFAFSAAELLTIYIIVNIGTVLAGQDLVQVIIYVIAYPAYFAVEKKWDVLFMQELPSRLIVGDTKVLRGFYLGQSNFFQPQNYNAWLMPLLIWGSLLIVVFWIMLCINVILRKQWTEREKLTFPIVQLPIALANTPGILRNKMLWLGFGISSFIALVNGLQKLYPALPVVPIKNFEMFYSPDRPWSILGHVTTSFYPFAIGLGMLMPTEMAFSCWFFLWVQKLELVASAARGLDSLMPEFPYLNQQAARALIGISIFTLWNERRYLAGVLRKAFGMSSDLDDKDEPMSYRTAVLGLILGLLAILFFCLSIGLSLWIAILFFGLYFTIAIGITRLRTELGAPVHDLYWIGPDTYMLDAVGSVGMGKHNLGILSLFYWLRRQYGSHPMPVQLEGFRMGECWVCSQGA